MAEWVPVAKVRDVPQGTMKHVQVKGQDVLLLNHEGRYYALSNACTHVGFPLHHGLFYDGLLTCAYHGAQFDVTTGNVVGPPARADLTRYDVEVRDEEVHILV